MILLLSLYPLDEWGKPKKILLFKSIPKIRCGVFNFLCGRGIVPNKPCEELGAINLVVKHLLTTGLESGSAFFGRHSDQLLNSLVELFYSTRLEGTIVATNRRIGRKDTCVYSVTEFIGIFQFAEVTDAANEVVEADEGDA